MQEMQVQSLGQEDPLGKEMTTHSSILAWKIPWAEEPGEVQSMGWQRVGHDWADWACNLYMQLDGVDFQKILKGLNKCIKFALM